MPLSALAEAGPAVAISAMAARARATICLRIRITSFPTEFRLPGAPHTWDAGASAGHPEMPPRGDYIPVNSARLPSAAGLRWAACRRTNGHPGEHGSRMPPCTGEVGSWRDGRLGDHFLAGHGGRNARARGGHLRLCALRQPSDPSRPAEPRAGPPPL